jgi:VWFA-related protein
MTLRVLTCIALALSCARIAAGQQAPPSFRSQIDAIEIDAYVADRAGQPVEGLTRDDFEILENGQPQTISSFALVKVPMAPAVAGDTPVQTNTDSNGRLYVIALGDMSPALALRAKNQVRQFITDRVAANDLVTIVSVGTAPASQTQDFTADKRLLLAALDRFDGGRNGQFARRMQGELLRDLLESVGRIPHRRKALLYVTDRSFDVFGVIRGSEDAAVADLSAMRAGFAIATRGHVTVYAIDPSGLPPTGGSGEGDGVAQVPRAVLDRNRDFRQLSELTGGFAVVNTNEYEAAFDRLVRENTTYYMLGFTSTSSSRDGKYRQLEVRLKRPGLSVHTRQGYIAPGENEPPSHTAMHPGVEFSPAVASALEHPVEVDAVPMWVMAASTPGGREGDVTVTAELDASTLAAERNSEIELGILAVGADGRTVRARRTRFAATPAAATLGSDGQRVRGAATITLPPGRYQLRVAGGAIGSNRAGSVLYDLDVAHAGTR